MKRKLADEKEAVASGSSDADVNETALVNATETSPEMKEEKEEEGKKPQKVPKPTQDSDEKKTSNLTLPKHLSELETVFNTIDMVISTASFKTQIPLSKIQDGAASIRGINITERQLLQIKRLWPESFVLKRGGEYMHRGDDNRNSNGKIFVYSYNCNYSIPNTLKKRADEFHQHVTEYMKTFFTEHNISEADWDKNIDKIPLIEPIPMSDVPMKGLSTIKNKENTKIGVKIGFNTKLNMKTPQIHTVIKPSSPEKNKFKVKGVDMEVLQKINSIERQRSEALQLRKSVQKEDILGNLPQVIIALRQAYFSDRKNVAPLDDAAQRLSKFLVPPVSQSGAESRLHFLSEVAPELIMITKPPPPPPMFDMPSGGRRKMQDSGSGGGVWVRWCKTLPQNTTEIFNRILSTSETSDLYLKYFGSSQTTVTGTKN